TAMRAAARQREPWQVMALDLKQSRGGLRDLHAHHWLDAVDALIEGRGVAPLPPELEVARERLLATRAAVHALSDRPNDMYRPENARAVGDWLGVDAFE